jgi:predicted nucleic acid-binding protein
MVGLSDDASTTARASFVIAAFDVDAPLRWAALRASTGLPLPDSIVLDTALVGGADAILTFDQRLAAAATSRSIDVPTASTPPDA